MSIQNYDYNKIIVSGTVEYISDLKYLDKWIVPAFKKMKWNEYRAEDIKRLMCYLYGE